MKLHPIAHPALSMLAIAMWAPIVSSAQRSSDSLTPERILEAIDVRVGHTVCEIGAGDGEMSIRVARIVGPNGRVYTSELGDNRMTKLREKVAASGVSHITVVPGDTARTNFPDAACDGIFMRDVYHHITEPAAMNLSISAALKPGGRVAVVDFAPPDKEASRPAGRAQDGTHGVSPETVSRELRDAGFEPVSLEQPGQRWFVVVLSKPKRQSGSNPDASPAASFRPQSPIFFNTALNGGSPRSASKIGSFLSSTRRLERSAMALSK